MIKMKVDIFIRISEVDENGFRNAFENYNELTIKKQTEIEDYEIIIRDVCDAINRGEVRKKLKDIGEDTLEE